MTDCVSVLIHHMDICCILCSQSAVIWCFLKTCTSVAGCLFVFTFGVVTLDINLQFIKLFPLNTVCKVR